MTSSFEPEPLFAQAIASEEFQMSRHSFVSFEKPSESSTEVDPNRRPSSLDPIDEDNRADSIDQNEAEAPGTKSKKKKKEKSKKKKKEKSRKKESTGRKKDRSDDVADSSSEWVDHFPPSIRNEGKIRRESLMSDQLNTSGLDDDPELVEFDAFQEGGFNDFIQNNGEQVPLVFEEVFPLPTTWESTPRTADTTKTVREAPQSDDKEMLPSVNQLVFKDNGHHFQDYLKSTIQDEKLAAATAEAFQAFLKFQMQSATKPEVPGSQMIGREIGGEKEDDISELGGSYMGTDWENGSFVSYGTMQQQQAFHAKQLVKLAEIERANAGSKVASNRSLATWGEIKRNENFVRLRTAPTGSDSNLVAVAQNPFTTQSNENTSVSQSSCVSSTSHSSVSSAKMRSFQEQWGSLSIEQRKVVSTLKRKWESRHPKEKYSDKWYLQFAKASPGRPFTMKTAYKVMKSTERHLIELCENGMSPKVEKLMLTKTMFPCPGLKTIDGLDVNYIRASRYSPKEQPIINMNEMSVFIMNHRHEEKENSALDGICVLVNMAGWTMRNFSMAYCRAVCLLIQGFLFPSRVSSFMLVDYPSWFGSIWSIMKPMLAPSFRRRVHFVKVSQLSDYLAPGFEQYLPDDIYGGQAKTDEVVHNFIKEKKAADVERLRS